MAAVVPEKKTQRPRDAKRDARRPKASAKTDRTSLAAIAAVCAVALISSIAGIVNQFTRDDLPVVVGDPRVHDLGHIAELLTLPYWPPPAHPDLYRPVASILLAVQYALGSGTPAVFRIVSILLYVAASVGVFQLARRILTTPVALGVALLFAAHPVHVEAVAQAVNQGELIVAGIACLMTVLFLDRRAAGMRTKDWLLLGALYFVATLVKETAFVIPLLILSADLLLPRDGERRSGGWFGYAILVAPGVLAFMMRTAIVGSASGSFVADALVNLGASGRLLTMLGVVPQWLRLLVWPAHLRVDYSPGEFVAATSFGPQQALGVAIVTAVVAAVWSTRRRAPVIAFGLSWCVIALLPVSNVLLPTGILIAERTLFSPSVGFLIAVGAAVQRIVAKAGTPQTSVRRLVVIGCAAFALVVAGIVRSAVREREWYDTQSLRAASLRDSPRSWRSQMAYGETLFGQGHVADAMVAYHEAIRWTATPWLVRNELSDRLRGVGADSAALAELRASLAEEPGQREASAKFIAALLAVGRYQEARDVADSIIAVAGAPRMIVGLRHVADSALVLHAPPGSVKVRVR